MIYFLTHHKVPIWLNSTQASNSKMLTWAPSSQDLDCPFQNRCLQMQRPSPLRGQLRTSADTEVSYRPTQGRRKTFLTHLKVRRGHCVEPSKGDMCCGTPKDTKGDWLISHPLMTSYCTLNKTETPHSGLQSAYAQAPAQASSLTCAAF